MRTGKLRNEAFQFALPVARHVFRGRSGGSVSSFVPLRRRFKARLSPDGKLRSSFPSGMVHVGRILTAREGDKSFSGAGNNIRVSLGRLRKIVRGGATDIKSGTLANRNLPEKIFKNSTTPASIRPVKLTSNSVFSFADRENATSFSKRVNFVSKALRRKKVESKELGRSVVRGNFGSAIFCGRDNNFSAMQDNNFIRFVGWKRNSVQSANNQSQDSMAPSGPLRKNLSENMMRNQNGKPRIVKEDFSPDEWGEFPSKSHSGMFERYDLERSSRLAARQGHGGVDELRFPQYPGRSIGMS